MTVADDTPLRLDAAAKLAFPDGSMTVSGLRREAKRGRLVVERIAGKDYTTLAYINQMREQCRIEARGPVSISDERGVTRPADILRSGLSSTAKISAARDALRTILQEPRKPSRAISPPNTPGPQGTLGAVIPIKSPSPMS